MPARRGGSQLSSRDGSRWEDVAARPAAIIWSMERPTRMLLPEVLRACSPVRKVAEARAWSPGPSPLPLAFLWPRPAMTWMSDLWASRAEREEPSEKVEPPPVGHQWALLTPLGT